MTRTKTGPRLNLCVPLPHVLRNMLDDEHRQTTKAAGVEVTMSAVVRALLIEAIGARQAARRTRP